MSHEHSMIIATFPNKEIARKIAKLLVEQRLVACAQLLPIESIYRWNGEICEEGEVMLFIKSKTDLFAEITVAIKTHHPYEVPEIIQIPISAGLPDYLRWINDCTKGANT
jgi:periplasmic divalent cation tolerance protein